MRGLFLFALSAYAYDAVGANLLAMPSNVHRLNHFLTHELP